MHFGGSGCGGNQVVPFFLRTYCWVGAWLSLNNVWNSISHFWKKPTSMSHCRSSIKTPFVYVVRFTQWLQWKATSWRNLKKWRCCYQVNLPFNHTILINHTSICYLHLGTRLKPVESMCQMSLYQMTNISVMTFHKLFFIGIVHLICNMILCVVRFPFLVRVFASWKDGRS